VSVSITCPVSGTELGAPARAWQSEYKGQTYYFCCSDCKKDFDKDPERYLKK
jgi:Cu+-exporting ATPase